MTGHGAAYNQVDLNYNLEINLRIVFWKKHEKVDFLVIIFWCGIMNME